MAGQPIYQRYQLPDEPKRPLWTRFYLPPLLWMIGTIYLALDVSPLFWLLPGVNGLLVNGNHRWRDIGLSVLALVIYIAGMATLIALDDARLLPIWPLRYGLDVVIALTVAPLVKVYIDQQRTIVYRSQLEGKGRF